MRNGDLLTLARDGDQFTGRARLLSRRHIGKVCFCGARFKEDQVQIMFNNQLPNYSELVGLPLGSIIAVRGHKIVTRTGMPTLQVTNAEPMFIYTGTMPDKHHGLSSALRYRNRVEYLMTDEDVFLFVKKISTTLHAMRKTLHAHSFREFPTGVLQETFEAGQAAAFSTHCRATGKQMHLSLTSELKLKRLIAGGFERVFEVGQSFRNEGIDHIHSPEFTMLEAYAAEARCTDMENLLEEIVATVVQDCQGDKTLMLQTDNSTESQAVSYQTPFVRLPFQEAFDRWVGDYQTCNREALTERFPQAFNHQMTRFTWLMKVVEQLIVPHIVVPTFLTKLPTGMSPFVHNNPDGTSERSFLISQGCFLADIYTDENDPEKISSALAQQATETGNTLNKDYLRVLELGMPPTASIGLGVNRLLMLMLGNLPYNIKETILYPIQ